MPHPTSPGETLTLAERIEALKDPAERGRDFDGRTWAWLILLGVAVPVLLLSLGWWL